MPTTVRYPSHGRRCLVSFTPDRTGIGARFLTAVGRAPADARGAEQICLACLTTLPVHRVGISVISGDDRLEFLCASDDIAERMEWAQIALGEGPAVESFTTGGPIFTADAAAPDTRWPLLSRQPEAADARSVYALPLQIGAIRVGALSLYPAPGTRLGNRDFADALAVADLVTSLLLAPGTTAEPNPLGHWWMQPQSSREIHQATGMVVAQLDVTVREAYARLQGYAFAHSRGLDDVAADVVHRGLRIDTDPEDDHAAQP